MKGALSGGEIIGEDMTNKMLGRAAVGSVGASHRTLKSIK